MAGKSELRGVVEVVCDFHCVTKTKDSGSVRCDKVLLGIGSSPPSFADVSPEDMLVTVARVGGVTGGGGVDWWRTSVREQTDFWRTTSFHDHMTNSNRVYCDARRVDRDNTPCPLPGTASSAQVSCAMLLCMAARIVAVGRPIYFCVALFT